MREGGKGQPKCPVTVFEYFGRNFASKSLEKLCIFEIKNVTLQRRKSISPEVTWEGRGSKISEKSVSYYCTDPYYLLFRFISKFNLGLDSIFRLIT
jgi:hypothetical protein